jgi:CxxC motif-containing protein (DUF1111 family)
MRFRIMAVPPVLALLIGAGCARSPHLGDPLAHLTRAQRQQFDDGKAVFERGFTEETGLGPLFNANACGECHEDPVSGGPGDEVENHVTLVRSDGSCDLLEARGGPVLQLHATPALTAALGLEQEPVPEGVPQGRRTTPDLFGFGLLDAVTEESILSRADPDDRDKDGISGRPNLTPDGRVGRFGRKALVASLREFNDVAFTFEQGITTPSHPSEDTIGGQPVPPGVDPAPDPELDRGAVESADAFVRFLAPPAQLPLDRYGRRGRKVFERIGCARCHVPVLTTGDNPIRALAHRKVAAYTDLLLHDMGGDLADICMGSAAPGEFRTEPLMGLHLVTRFLHDGRAMSIDEAIRLHGGEASRSRELYQSLDDKERGDLASFLKCL